MRDYEAWHDAYDDPDSTMSWRLATVRARIDAALDRHAGPVRLLSLCAGDGRDVLGVLRARSDADRVHATLVELHPALAQRARDAAAGLDVEVRTADAGVTDAYVGAVPADVLLLVGIFGNISEADIERTIRLVPQLCAAGATVLWSRGLFGRDDGNAGVRGWLADVGCTELDYAERRSGSSNPALGAARFDGTPLPLQPGSPVFTFLR